MDRARSERPRAAFGTVEIARILERDLSAQYRARADASGCRLPAGDSTRTTHADAGIVDGSRLRVA